METNLSKSPSSKFSRRFVIYGPTSSGKSTLAQQISWRIGVPHIELDALFWLPDWKEKSFEQFRADVLAALNRCDDGWVCDGNYSKVRELILPLADTVIWLRPPFRIAFWRLLKRTFVRVSKEGTALGDKSRIFTEGFFQPRFADTVSDNSLA